MDFGELIRSVLGGEGKLPGQPTGLTGYAPTQLDPSLNVPRVATELEETPKLSDKIKEAFVEALSLEGVGKTAKTLADFGRETPITQLAGALGDPMSWLNGLSQLGAETGLIDASKYPAQFGAGTHALGELGDRPTAGIGGIPKSPKSPMTQMLSEGISVPEKIQLAEAVGITQPDLLAQFDKYAPEMEQVSNEDKLMAALTGAIGGYQRADPSEGFGQNLLDISMGMMPAVAGIVGKEKDLASDFKRDERDYAMKRIMLQQEMQKQMASEKAASSLADYRTGTLDLQRDKMGKVEEGVDIDKNLHFMMLNHPDIFQQSMKNVQTKASGMDSTMQKYLLMSNMMKALGMGGMGQ